jgi:hypothetical protein
MALLALASVTEVAARYRGVMNNNVFVPNLRDLMALSSPFTAAGCRGAATN